MLTHEDPADLNISDELDRDMDPYTMPAGPSRTVQQRVPEKRKMSQADDLKCTQSGSVQDWRKLPQALNVSMKKFCIFCTQAKVGHYIHFLTNATKAGTFKTT